MKTIMTVKCVAALVLAASLTVNAQGAGGGKGGGGKGGGQGNRLKSNSWHFVSLCGLPERIPVLAFQRDRLRQHRALNTLGLVGADHW